MRSYWVSVIRGRVSVGVALAAIGKWIDFGEDNGRFASCPINPNATWSIWSLPIYAFLAMDFHNLPQIFADPSPISAKALDILALRSPVRVIFVKHTHKVYRTRHAGQERWFGEDP